MFLARVSGWCHSSGMDTDANVMGFFFRRVGDAERDGCVELLVEHFLRGRLSAEELDRRQDAALRATTAVELAGLVADLPHPVPASRSASTLPLPSATAADPASLALPRPSRAKVWTRRYGPPAAVAITAWLATMGLGDGGAHEAALNASLVTGAVGYVTTWLACAHKSRISSD